MTGRFWDGRRGRALLMMLCGLCALGAWVAPVPGFFAGRPSLGLQAALPAAPADAPAPDMSQMIARPLFWPSRRPVPPAVPVALPPVVTHVAPSAPPTTGMVLLGVMNNGGESVALMTLPNDPTPRVVRPGTAIEGGMISQILSDHVVLRMAGKDYVVGFVSSQVPAGGGVSAPASVGFGVPSPPALGSPLPAIPGWSTPSSSGFMPPRFQQ